MDKTAVSDGFHNTTFPIRAGPVAKFAPIAEKLNGEIAATNPYKKNIKYIETEIAISMCAFKS